MMMLILPSLSSSHSMASLFAQTQELYDDLILAAVLLSLNNTSKTPRCHRCNSLIFVFVKQENTTTPMRSLQTNAEAFLLLSAELVNDCCFLRFEKEI